MRYDEEEPQRFLGIPIGPAGHDAEPGGGPESVRGGRYDTRPRVLGIPTSGFRQKPIDLTWLRHPVRRIRWRREVRRHGPYAPSFDDFR